jgi:hypothetical protein
MSDSEEPTPEPYRSAARTRHRGGPGTTPAAPAGLRATIWLIAFLGIILTACGSETSPFPEGSVTIVANADIGVGESRIQVGVVGPDGDRLGGPDVPVSLRIAAGDDEEAATYEAEWIWLIEDIVGLYKTEAVFDTPGVWTVSVTPESGTPLPATGFQVFDSTFAPDVGDAAPLAPIDTLATKPLGELTTDPDPDEDFYRQTLEEAFSSGRSTVVVFSTPAFCRTATCGPALDIVKGVKPEYPDVNFVHVEVYTDLQNPDFRPSPEFLAPALGAEYWNLPTEPWVFVVDAEGIVTARFEGTATTEDLRSSLG